MVPSDGPSGLQATEREADLARELTEAKEKIARLEDDEWYLRRLLEVTQETLAFFDKGVVVRVNPQFVPMFRYEMAEAIGMHALDFVAPESHELVAHNQRTGYTEPYEAMLRRKDGSTFIARIRGKPVERNGRVLRVSAFIDLTEQKRAEEAARLAAVQQESIRAQDELLACLSTPLLPIAKGVLVLPLIGQVNRARAGQVLETLTRGVAEHRAEVAILDVTGVEALDIHVADLLLSASRAVRLLGAEVLLTGIRPDVARTLIGLGSDLRSLIPFTTLQQGVAYALRRQGAAGARPR